MPSTETIMASVLVTVTCGSAIIFGFRQLRYLRAHSDTATDDAVMLKKSAVRRLIVSLFLICAGLLIAATYLSGLAAEMERIGIEREQVAAEARAPLSDADKHSVRSFTYLWIVALCCVGAAVLLIGYDMFHVRKHWTQRLNRLRNDRRAMLDRQLSRLRAERGYSNGRHVDE
jgi:type VI protein secretion system component VasF